MKTKTEQLMIIEALGTLIARRKQKNNRRERKLQQLEVEGVTGLHQLRRNIYRVAEEILHFELLKERLEGEFDEN